MGLADTGNKKWVVIINRSPRGPLTTEQVATLLAERVIKTTDIASVSPPPGSSEKSDWKFLWQFPEFDRRKKAGDTVDPAEGDRRAQTTIPEAMAAKIKSATENLQPGQVPEELRNIDMGDLVPSQARPDTQVAPEWLDAASQTAVPGSSSSTEIPRAVYLALVAALLVVGYLSQLFWNTPKLGGGASAQTASSPTRKTEDRDSITRTQIQAPKRETVERMEVNPRAAVKESEEERTPASRDSGVVEKEENTEEDEEQEAESGTKAKKTTTREAASASEEGEEEGTSPEPKAENADPLAGDAKPIEE